MIKIGDIIHFKEDTSIWGVVTCFSDDGTTLYYKRNGCGLSRSSARIDKVEKD